MIDRSNCDWLKSVKRTVGDTERCTLQLIESGELSTDSELYTTIYDINQKSHSILSAIRTYFP